MISQSYYSVKVSTSGIRSCMCHCCSPGSSVFIEVIDSCVCADSRAIEVLL